MSASVSIEPALGFALNPNISHHWMDAHRPIAWRIEGGQCLRGGHHTSQRGAVWMSTFVNSRGAIVGAVFEE